MSLRRSVVLVALALLVSTSAALGKEHVLALDSGRMESKQSSAGTGHVIAFETPQGKWWIKAVRIHGARYGGGYDAAATTFRLGVCDEKLRPVAEETASYELFDHGKFGWVDVRLATPVKAPKRFKIAVAFDPAATRGVYVAWAKTTESHSGYGLPGGRERPAERDREWMIRVVLTDKEPKPGDVVELAHDDGEPIGKQSLGGDGHAIEFRKPPGTWWLRSVRIHGQLYGGGYDPATTPFRVTVCSPSMKPFHQQEARCGLFGGDAAAWASVPATAAVRMTSRFRICVDFDPTATRGVFVSYAKTRTTHSYEALPSSNARKWRKGEWMIRVVLTKTKPDLPDAKPPKPRPAGTYLDDLEFLERTVRDGFPALEKKGVDWKSVVEAWRPRFVACKDDRTHIANVRRVLAILGDVHTGVTKTKVSSPSPAFAGLQGAGLWIATSPDDRRRIVRAHAPDFPLATKVPVGSELIAIDSRSAAVVHAEVRAKLREWSGWSSTHFLDARLSFQFFPFGEKSELPATFLTPSGKIVEVSLPRGSLVRRASVSMPEGVDAKGLAVSGMLDGGIGYIRILGGMNDETQAAFFAAFEKILDAKGVLLDCRGMGGGGDGAAWAMAGRFFAKSTPQGSAPPLRSEGRAFAGPVVMLQDEREVSSAETFTWAMTETGRVVSVGRPTAGGTIIPRSFSMPSGVLSFRMGCSDRRTPMRGVQPEGIGTPPDVFVPYEPHLLAGGEDPEIAIGISVLKALVADRPREKVIANHAEIPRDERIDRFVEDEVRRVEVLGDRLPGRDATAARLERLAKAAKAAGREDAAKAARKALAGIRESD